MQTDTTKRHHFPPTGMVAKRTMTSAVKEMQESELSPTAGGDIKWFGRSGWRPGSSWNSKQSPCDPSTLLLGTSSREMKTSVHKKSCTRVHSSINHNRQKVKTTWMSSQQMKEKIKHSTSRERDNRPKRGWRHNMDEPWKHWAKWQELDTAPHDFTYMKCPEQGNLQRQKTGPRLLRLGLWTKRKQLRLWGVCLFLNWWKCPEADCGDGHTCLRIHGAHWIVNL